MVFFMGGLGRGGPCHGHPRQFQLAYPDYRSRAGRHEPGKTPQTPVKSPYSMAGSAQSHSLCKCTLTLKPSRGSGSRNSELISSYISSSISYEPLGRSALRFAMRCRQSESLACT